MVEARGPGGKRNADARRGPSVVEVGMRRWTFALLAATACAADTASLEPSEVPDAPRVELTLVDEPSIYQTVSAIEGDVVRLALAFPGCPYAWPYPLWLHNTGNRPLEGGVALEGPLALLAPAPARLEPGERVLLSVVVEGPPTHGVDASLVARYRHGDTEVVGRRAFRARVSDGERVEQFSIPELPVHHIVLVVDGSAETSRHADALDATLRNAHAALAGQIRLRWSIALGSPGQPLLLDLGAGLVLEDPHDVTGLIAAARGALGSGRTGDALGAAVQALDALGLGDGAWDVLVFSAVDSLPTDLTALQARGGAFLFQAGGARCGAPPTPVLDAVAMAFGGDLAVVCEPIVVAYNPIATRRELSLSGGPQPDSLRVEVDGVELPAQAPNGQLNWWWEAATARLRLADSVWPGPGSTVAVRYRETCFPSVDDFDWR